MKATGNLLGTILDLGREMMVTGAEVWRVEDMLEKLFDAYCFKDWEVWVVSSCLAATVYTWDDREYTQIRIIKGRSYDLDKLERLYRLADEVFETPTSVNAIRMKVNTIIESPGLPTLQTYVATVMAGVGFAVFYNGSLMDAFVVFIMSLVFTTYTRRIGKMINNMLAFNVVGAFIIEMIALAAMAGGIGQNLASITTAGILLLAGGLGIANGIGDFLHGDILAGVGETSTSLLGAVGIAIGIYLSMLFFSSFLRTQVAVNGANLAADPGIQLISCTIGCAGFVLMFGARKKALLYSTVGSFLTWFVYLFAVNEFGCGFFIATMVSSCFIALYASIVNAFTGIPSAIFLTSCVFPLLPGSNLYYTVFGSVSDNPELFRTQGRAMVLIALGIALGYITMDVVSNIIQIIRNTYFRRP